MLKHINANMHRHSTAQHSTAHTPEDCQHWSLYITVADVTMG